MKKIRSNVFELMFFECWCCTCVSKPWLKKIKDVVLNLVKFRNYIQSSVVVNCSNPVSTYVTDTSYSTRFDSIRITKFCRELVGTLRRLSRCTPAVGKFNWRIDARSGSSSRLGEFVGTGFFHKISRTSDVSVMCGASFSTTQLGIWTEISGHIFQFFSTVLPRILLYFFSGYRRRLPAWSSRAWATKNNTIRTCRPASTCPVVSPPSPLSC